MSYVCVANIFVIKFVHGMCVFVYVCWFVCVYVWLVTMCLFLYVCCMYECIVHVFRMCMFVYDLCVCHDYVFVLFSAFVF